MGRASSVSSFTSTAAMPSRSLSKRPSNAVVVSSMRCAAPSKLHQCAQIDAANWGRRRYRRSILSRRPAPCPSSATPPPRVEDALHDGASGPAQAGACDRAYRTCDSAPQPHLQQLRQQPLHRVCDMLSFGRAPFGCPASLLHTVLLLRGWFVEGHDVELS